METEKRVAYNPTEKGRGHEYRTQAINNLSIRYLNKAKNISNDADFLAFIERSTERISKGTSKVTYEELDAISRANNDDSITIDETMKLVRCSLRYFKEYLKSRIRKFKQCGNYSKTDIDLLIEQNRMANRKKLRINLHD